MKYMKVAMIVLLVLMCSSCMLKNFNRDIHFEHTVIKTINIKNPSFLVVTEKDDNKYYLGQIEDILISQKIDLFMPDTKTINSETSGSVGVAFLRDSYNDTNSGSVIDLYNTKADCIMIYNCYDYTFKIIDVKTRALLIKGTITYSLEEDIPYILKELINL